MVTQPPLGAQEMPLLHKKLYIPPLRRDAQRMPRPRLIERLDAGVRNKLTLISAPAGFGKTTPLSEWVSHFRFPISDFGLDSPKEKSIQNPPSKIQNPRVAWLSLDKSDNDPTRFLAYSIAALQTIEANIGQGALSALESPQPPPTEAVLTSLINEVAAVPDGIILVLDDYHLIEAQPIHDALTFLLRRLPPQMHLVIATREDPHLPLTRLRAWGQVTELRATDLRFTPSDAAAGISPSGIPCAPRRRLHCASDPVTCGTIGLPARRALSLTESLFCYIISPSN